MIDLRLAIATSAQPTYTCTLSPQSISSFSKSVSPRTWRNLRPRRLSRERLRSASDGKFGELFAAANAAVEAAPALGKGDAPVPGFTRARNVIPVVSSSSPMR